ncbi:Nucleolar complex protein 2, partial [Clarias magur]
AAKSLSGERGPPGQMTISLPFCLNEVWRYGRWASEHVSPKQSVCGICPYLSQSMSH